MKEVLIVTYCDGEHRLDRARGTHEHTISIDGAKPIALDLCDEHDGLIEQVKALLERGVAVKQGGYARPSRAETTRGVDQQLPCLEPGCQRTFRNRAGLAQHLIRTHHKSLADYPEGPAASGG